MNSTQNATIINFFGPVEQDSWWGGISLEDFEQKLKEEDLEIYGDYGLSVNKILRRSIS